LDSVENPEPSDPVGCSRTLQPDYAADNVDSFTPDGLYLYSETQRQQVAKWWSSDDPDSLWSKVYASALKSLPKPLPNVINAVGRPAFITAMEAGETAMVAALTAVLIAFPPLAADVEASGFGIDLQLCSALLEVLYHIPNKIVNQMLNEFAFDCVDGFPSDNKCVDAIGNPISDPLTSSNYLDHPGSGHAVSPDNIHMFWDRPFFANVDVIRGIYGWNLPADVVVGVIKRPVCQKIRSNGTATITGFVNYKGRVVVGATIVAGCQRTIQLLDEFFTLKVKAGGLCKVVARYYDFDGSLSGHPGRTLYGEVMVPSSWQQGNVIQANDYYQITIQLLDPPECMRDVIIEGDITVDDVSMGGTDTHTMHFKTNPPLQVQVGTPVYTEISQGVFAWVCDTSDPKSWLHDIGHVSNTPNGDDSNGFLDMDVVIHDQNLPPNDPDFLSVDVTLKATLNPGDDNLSVIIAGGPIHVRKDETWTMSTEAFLDTGGFFPDRAHFSNIRITNASKNAF
jgi:hypothetical protein